MQFIDLKAQQKYIRHDIDRRIAALLDHGQYILGPEVQEALSRVTVIRTPGPEALEEIQRLSGV